jgi:membrane associated rhomboid family serine protease
MFVIPIGTKASLALKPKVTISLIAINVLIGLFTFPMMMQTEKDLLKVQRERYAMQVRLYISEHSSESSYDRYFDSHIHEAVRDIKNAEDYYELEVGVMEALTYAGVDIDDLQDYENVLAEREESYYELYDDQIYDFREWKRLYEKEDKVLSANVIHSLGLVPSKMSRVHTFISYLFLHGGLWHLLGNMLFLWVVGCLLEDSWGRAPFIIFYAIGGVIAGLAHCLQDTSSSVPLIGASGAIAALMGAFTIRHFFTKIKFFYFFIIFFRPFWGTFHLPAFVFLPFWFAQQLFMKYLTDFVGGSDVAYLAHIAGYLMGICTALAVRATGFEDRFIAPRVQRKQVDEGVLKDPRFDEACDMLEKGNTERAKMLFTQLIRSRPNDPNLLQDIAIMYKGKGMMHDYWTASGMALKNLLLKSRFEEAAVIALEMIIDPEARQININPQVLMRIGKWLTEQERYGDAHDIYRATIGQEGPPHAKAKASMALAKLLYEKMSNPRDAVDVLDVAGELQLEADWVERINELKILILQTHPELKEAKPLTELLI